MYIQYTYIWISLTQLKKCNLIAMEEGIVERRI